MYRSRCVLRASMLVSKIAVALLSPCSATDDQVSATSPSPLLTPRHRLHPSSPPAER